MHFTQRQRLPRLVTAVRQRPSLLGIGIDEGTAILVCRRRFEVLGTGTVTTVEAGGKRPDVRVRVSRAGGFFDLERRRTLR
jgi:cyanophycinase-like exopeptidase